MSRRLPWAPPRAAGSCGALENEEASGPSAFPPGRGHQPGFLLGREWPEGPSVPGCPVVDGMAGVTWPPRLLGAGASRGGRGHWTNAGRDASLSSRNPARGSPGRAFPGSSGW